MHQFYQLYKLLSCLQWGKCAAGCKADPAGSYLPAAPRSAVAGREVTVGQLVSLIQHYTGAPKQTRFAPS